MTRCKFQCQEVTKRANWEHSRNKDAPEFVFEAKFSAVTGDSEENKKFFQWTPNGQLSIGVYTQDAFKPGKSYYLDISEVE